MKVALHPCSVVYGFHNPAIGPRPKPCRQARPFFATRRMGRLHRVKNMTVHFRWIDRARGTYKVDHISVGCWCGQVSSATRAGSLLLDAPLEGWPVCGTCEGRAVGAGQVASEVLTGQALTFTPRSKAFEVAP